MELLTNKADSTPPNRGSASEKEEFRTEMRNGVIWGIQRCVTDFGDRFRLERLIQSQIIERLTRGTRFEGSYGVLIGIYGGIEDGAGLIGKLFGGYKSNRSLSKVRTAATFMSIAMIPALLPLGVLFVQRKAPQFWPFYIAALVALTFTVILEWTGNVCHSELLSRLFTTKRRGRILGITAGVSNVVRLLSGGSLFVMLGLANFPMPFVWVGLIGVVVMGLGAVIIVFCREIPSLKSPPIREKANLVSAVRVVVKDRRYMFFLVAAVMKYGFFAGHLLVIPTANRLLGLPPKWEGIYVVIESIAAFFAYPISGYVADKFGRGVTALGGAGLAAVGMVWFAHMSTRTEFIVTYIMMFLGFAIVGRMIYLATVELSPPEGRGTFVAARYIAESGAGLVFKPSIGLIRDYLARIGQAHWAFYMCAAMGLLTGIIVFMAAPRSTMDMHPRAQSS